MSQVNMYSKNIKDFNLNEVIKNYYVYAKDNISAGDFVEFVNGIASQSTTTKTYTSTDTELDTNAYMLSNQKRCCATLLNDGKVFIAYAYSSSYYLYGVVCTINGSTITKGTAVKIHSNGRQIELCTMPNGNVFIAHATSSGSGSVYGTVCSISGTTITFGTAVSIDSIASATYAITVSQLTDTTVFVGYKRSSYLYGNVCTLSGTTITKGTSVKNSSTIGSSVSSDRLSNTSVFIAHGDSNNYLYATVATISGTTITFGTAKKLRGDSEGSSTYLSATKLSGGNVVVFHSYNSSYHIAAVACSISGTTITPGSVLIINNGGSHSGHTAIVSIPLSDNRALVGFSQLFFKCIVSVSGTTITNNGITLGTNGYAGHQIAPVLLKSGNVFFAHTKDATSEQYKYLMGIVYGISNNKCTTTVKESTTTTTYETQVKKATSNSKFNGIARTSGMGGTDTAHNEKVEVNVIGNLFSTTDKSWSLASVSIKMTNNVLTLSGTSSGNTGKVTLAGGLNLPTGNYRVYIKGASNGTYEILNKAGTIMYYGGSNKVYNVTNKDINSIVYYSSGSGIVHNSTVEFAIYRDDDIEDRNSNYYLEGTGTQYIDTGYKHNQDTRIVLDFEIPIHRKWGNIIGSYGGASGTNKLFFLGQLGGENQDCFYAGYGVTWDSSIPTLGRHRLDFNKNILKLDDTVHTFATKTFTSDFNLYLFGVTGYTNLPSVAPVKIYSCKIYDNNTLKFDFVPAIDINSGKPCMYDRVSKTYFLNKGTGDFIFGNNKQPKRYLQSNGTQAIDTEIVPSSKTRMEVTFNLTRTDVRSRMGWGSSGSQEAFMVGASADYGFDSFVSSNYQRKIAKATLDTDIHTFDVQSGSQKFDGVEYATDTIGDTASPGQSLYLFGSHVEWSSAIDSPAYMNLYKCRIWENGVLVRDFIPATTMLGVNCLYDKVSKRYFYSKTDVKHFVIGQNAQYTPLKYIESTGTQYIDTGIAPKLNYTIETGFQAINVPSGESWLYAVWETSGFRCGIEKGAYDATRGFTYSQTTNGTGYMDGYGVNTIKDYTLNAYLFSQNENNTAKYTSTSKYKLFYCKIWDANHILLRDFIPVLDSDGIACLYDNVSQNYFYNKGTGNFIAGKVIELESVESTGSQYIDTGIIPDTTTTFEICAEATTPLTQEDACLFGSRTNNGTDEYVLWDCHYTEQVDHICAFVTRNFGSTPRLSLNQKKNVFKYDGSAFYVNGEKQLDKTNDMTTAKYPMYLFGLNQDGSLEPRSYKGRVYYFKIWKNGTLVRFFVPVLDGKGIPCLYDSISQGFFYNKGTNNFIAHRKPKEKRMIELDYIESTGTQYIDTEVSTTSTTKFVLDVQHTSNEGFNLNGVSYYSENGRFSMGNSSDFSGFYFGIGSKNLSLGTRDLNRHTMYIDAQNLTYGIADLDLSATIDSSEIKAGYPIYLFARSNNGAAENQSKQRLYSAQIYDNNIIVRDFIPVLDPDRIPCLYDKISKKYFYNKGTKGFKAGEPKYHPVDYIKSTGSQYIDTKIVPNSTTKVEIKFKLNRTDITQNMLWAGTSPTEAFAIECNNGSSSPSNAGFNSIVSSNFTRQQTGKALDTEIHTYDLQSGSQKFDGVEYGTSTIGDTAEIGQTMYLLGVHAEWVTTGPHLLNYANLYYCKIWKGNNLVRDFIPVIDLNGTACLYDKVSKELFYSLGTEDFIAGNEQYKELEYLESTCSQYIDTLVPTSKKTRFEIDVQYTNTSVSSVNGVAGFTTNTRCAMGYSVDSTYPGFYFGVAGVNTSLGTKDTDRHQFYIDYKNSKFGITDLGLSGDITTELAGGHNILLFARNNGNSTPNLPAYQKLYGAKIYEDDVLVRDFIPVLDLEGKACLYDKVSKEFFYNKVDNNFIMGFKPHQEIECIKSTGTQYIDTEITPTKDTRMELKFKMNSTANYQVLGGCASDATSEAFYMEATTTNFVTFVSDNYSSINTGVPVDTTDIHTFDIQSGSQRLDGIEYGTDVFSDAHSGEFSMYLFGLHANWASKPQSLAKYQLYYCKIYDNDILVRDFVPVRILDGTLCLYDKVSEKYFYNKGTESFSI